MKRECNVKRKTAKISKILIHSFRGQQALDRAGEQGGTRVLVARCKFERRRGREQIHASIAEHHVGQIKNHVGAQPSAEHQRNGDANHQPHRSACHTRARQQAQRGRLCIKRWDKRVWLNRRRHGEDYTSRISEHGRHRTEGITLAACAEAHSQRQTQSTNIMRPEWSQRVTAGHSGSRRVTAGHGPVRIFRASSTRFRCAREISASGLLPMMR